MKKIIKNLLILILTSLGITQTKLSNASEISKNSQILQAINTGYKDANSCGSNIKKGCNGCCECQANSCGACQNNGCCNNCALNYWGKTFLQPRSQNTNTARRAVGNHYLRHRFDPERFKKHKIAPSLTVTPEYGQAFKPYHTAQYFFSTDNLEFQGSMIAGKSINSLLADYFGLSPAFDGEILFKPQIKTFLVDFDFMLEFMHGLYLQIYSPIVKTWWQMQMGSNTEQYGQNTPYPAGYMAENAVVAPSCSIQNSLAGNVAFGDVIEGIKYGKFSPCALDTTKVADITFLLGWIFLNRDNGYVGANLQVVAPTGTRPYNNYIFEPIAGNGHHVEFNFGFKGEVGIWEKDDRERVNFHFDANLGTLMNTCQRRSFDFKCDKFFSRYMLLKEFDEDGNYTQLVPAINITTLKCNVKMGFQLDFDLMFAYYNPHWEFDFGYNGWLRSHEEISLIDTIPDRRYALKGIQDVSGLSAELTQSTATIYGNPFDEQAQVADPNSPVFICTSNLDICSAANPKVMTHKFFSNLSYKRDKENSLFTPYAGIGSQIEFESLNPRLEYPYKNTLFQWGLWLKIGLNYN